MNWANRHWEIFVFAALILFFLLLVLLKWAIQFFIRWMGKKIMEIEWLIGGDIQNYNIADNEAKNATKNQTNLLVSSVSNLPPNDDDALSVWLENNYDERMWWKEFLHHEGVRNRDFKERESAKDCYDRAMDRLAKAESVKKEESITRWMAEGMTEQQASERWETIARKIYQDSRMQYAFQKD